VNNDFLDFIRAGKRGPLKVFLGMSAGVGKTVAMLREGHRLRREGVDVVVGVVLTHGRAETESEIGALERVPLRALEHRGVPFEEMDVEAIARRKPDAVLVDELAHTNVPGSKHEKRWQDVEELRDQGVSVLSTLNVQHLESLHDLILRETAVDVRERVPDRIVMSADEVVVIDLPPGELRERLREGKIYPSHKVEQALHGFFREENLVALRQIALREVANAVEAKGESLAALRPKQDSRPAAIAERVMVCMSSQPTGAERLLRSGARLAGGPNAKWFVVYVRQPHESARRIDTRSLRSMSDNIDLARQLGADVVRLEGADVPQVLAEFARARKVTHVVFGRTRLPAWRERLRGSFIDRFMRLCPEVDVVVVGSHGEAK